LDFIDRSKFSALPRELDIGGILYPFGIPQDLAMGEAETDRR
jgi:hypothetical protein